MRGPKSRLPQPTYQLVRSYIEKFDNSQVIVECALEKLFRLFPDKTAAENVLLKVVVLNSLYGTGILAVSRVADHILELDIDPLIQAGQPEAVELIGRVRIGDKTRYNYSFATKYCSWHNRSAYSIYDSFVEQVLWDYKLQDGFSDFRRQDLLDYQRFQQVVIDFRQHYRLTAFDLKDIDKFLWLAGKAQYTATVAHAGVEGKAGG